MILGRKHCSVNVSEENVLFLFLVKQFGVLPVALTHTNPAVPMFVKPLRISYPKSWCSWSVGSNLPKVTHDTIVDRDSALWPTILP